MADKAGKEGFGSQFFSGLFWKTFGALFILVLTSVCAWLYGLAVLNEAPRAQAASLRWRSSIFAAYSILPGSRGKQLFGPCLICFA